jgi:hypothetical protein
MTQVLPTLSEMARSDRPSPLMSPAELPNCPIRDPFHPAGGIIFDPNVPSMRPARDLRAGYLRIPFIGYHLQGRSQAAGKEAGVNDCLILMI